MNSVATTCRAIGSILTHITTKKQTREFLALIHDDAWDGMFQILDLAGR